MKKTIQDYELEGKRVIIRCDLNVPIKDGVIQDDTRIVASITTIRYAIQMGARVILFSHLGKVKEEADLKKNDLYPVSIRLGELLEKEVFFSNKTRGEELEKMISSLKSGDVLLVQNTRYEDLVGKKESTCDMELAKYWANLGDIFINDAYGTCHRAHASNVGIAKLLPNGIGFLVKEEIDKLEGILSENTRPFMIMMGGAKVHDKIKVIENLISKCDRLLIGGGMAYTFLKAKGYPIGSSLMDEESLAFCRDILARYGEKILLPIDHIVSSSLTDSYFSIKKIENTLLEEMGLDIGPRTVELYCHELEKAKRVIINGPMGCFEDPRYAKGTRAIYDFITKHEIKTFIGGGDSAASVQQLSIPSNFYYISTGGGATLEYLGGTVLPGISVIHEKEQV